MNISNLGQKMETSLTRQLFMLAKNYTDTIDLTLGDPNFVTPKPICDAAANAVSQGNTHYSMNAGRLEARKAIVDTLHERYNVNYSVDNVIVTCGAMGALYQCLRCLVNPGDEVLIPTPHWVNYTQMTMMCGGTTVFVPTESDKGFHINPEEIEKCITDKARVLIINSPNNPTGAVLSEDEVRQIADIVIKYKLALITDEAYSSICYDDQYFSFLQIPEVLPYVVMVDSCSKRYAMTGWRVGYAVGPRELIESMVKMQENVVACATVPAQLAMAEALRGSQEQVQFMRDAFRERRDYLYSRVKDMQNVRMYLPEGTFYAFIDISDTNQDSLSFAMDVLKSVHVAVVPGITYGSMGDQYIRVAYTVSMEQLVEACDRLERYLKEKFA